MQFLMEEHLSDSCRLIKRSVNRALKETAVVSYKSCRQGAGKLYVQSSRRLKIHIDTEIPLCTRLPILYCTY